MDLDVTPFEIVEEHKRTILRLHGTAENPVEIENSDTVTILNALAEGHEIHGRNSIFPGTQDNVGSGRPKVLVQTYRLAETAFDAVARVCFAETFGNDECQPRSGRRFGRVC